MPDKLFWNGVKETRRATHACVRTFIYNNENGFEKLCECEYSNRYGKKATSTTMVRVGGLCVFKGLKRPTHKGPFREFSLVGAG